MIDFCSRIREGSKLEVFDIHIYDDVKKILESIDTEKENRDHVQETSYFYTYFLYKMTSILQIPEDKLFTATYAFKPRFIRKLIDESLVAHLALDNFRINSIAKLIAKKKIIAHTFLVLKWVVPVNADPQIHKQRGTPEGSNTSKNLHQHLLNVVLSFLH